MLISGTSIPANFNVKIKKGFTPETDYALKWIPLSSGNYSCTDRGAAQDKYECTVDFYSTEQTEINSKKSINEIINALEANRTAGSNVIQLSNINAGEYIFGADIDYSGTLNCTALTIDRRTQNTWKGWGLSMRLVVSSPSFTGSPVLPVLRCVDVGIDADTDRTINKFRAYDTTLYYADHASDKGLFVGTFTFTTSEMQGLRRYVATQRGSTITISNILGVSYPWGRRTTSYPLSAKILKFEDMGMFGNSRWKAKITFAESTV